MTDISKGTVLKMVPKGQPVEEEPDNGAERILVDLLDRIRAGTFKPEILIIHCMYHDARTPAVGRHAYWSHGATPLQHLGVLDVARHSLLTEQ